MKTWNDINQELDSVLGDTGSISYPAASRIYSWNRACEYFAVTHTADMKTVTASATGGVVSLPDDFLSLAGIEDTENGRWLEPQVIVPGLSPPTEGFVQISGRSVYLYQTPTSLNLWYYGVYATVTALSSYIVLPSWAEWAIMNLAIAYMLYPSMVGQADLRRFQSRREAGDPEDNPPRSQARFHLSVYNEIVSRVKPQDREVIFRPGAR